MVMKCGLFAIAKDEAPYLVEWVDFHRSIGFDHVTIYDNGSTDGGLDPFKTMKDVTILDWPYVVGQPSQNTAYADYVKNYAHAFDWVMSLDIDEFLNLKKAETIGAFLDAFPAADGVAINWRMFGSSGHGTYEPGPVLKRFTRASPPSFGPNAHVKTAFRPRSVLRPEIHSPVFKLGVTFVDARNAILPATEVNVLHHAIDLSIAQINHYFTKSEEEFMIKRSRGKADHVHDSPGKHRDLSEFQAYDRNEEEDTTILRLMKAEGGSLQ